MWFKKVISLSVLFALCWGVQAQEFTDIYGNLNRLNEIIKNEIDSNLNMQKDNESLKTALNTLNELLREQGRLLNEQEANSKNQQAISEKQAQLLGQYMSKSRNLTIGLIIGIPAAAGLGVLAGWLVSINR